MTPWPFGISMSDALHKFAGLNFRQGDPQQIKHSRHLFYVASPYVTIIVPEGEPGSTEADNYGR